MVFFLILGKSRLVKYYNLARLGAYQPLVSVKRALLVALVSEQATLGGGRLTSHYG